MKYERRNGIPFEKTSRSKRLIAGKFSTQISRLSGKRNDHVSLALMVFPRSRGKGGVACQLFLDTDPQFQLGLCTVRC